jgi:hypothetical protein
MDPDAALKQARACAEDYDTETGNPAYEAAIEALEAYRALDDWITDGGFLPKAWAATVGALPAL